MARRPFFFRAIQGGLLHILSESCFQREISLTNAKPHSHQAKTRALSLQWPSMAIRLSYVSVGLVTRSVQIAILVAGCMTYQYLYIYISLYLDTNTHIYHIYIYNHRLIYTYIHTCMHACMHACIHTSVRTYVHTSIHMYIHIVSCYVCIIFNMIQPVQSTSSSL